MNLKISLIKVHYILFYSLLIIFFHLYKRVKRRKTQILQGERVELQLTRFVAPW